MNRRRVVLATVLAALPLRMRAEAVPNDVPPSPLEGEVVEGPHGTYCIIDDWGDCVYPDALGGRRKRKHRVYAERRKRRRRRKQSD